MVWICKNEILKSKLGSKPTTNLCPLQEAMLHFRRRHDNVKFLVFSEDPAWCGRQSLLATEDVLIVGRDTENKKSAKGKYKYLHHQGHPGTPNLFQILLGRVFLL